MKSSFIPNRNQINQPKQSLPEPDEATFHRTGEQSVGQGSLCCQLVSLWLPVSQFPCFSALSTRFYGALVLCNINAEKKVKKPVRRKNTACWVASYMKRKTTAVAELSTSKWAQKTRTATSYWNALAFQYLQGRSPGYRKKPQCLGRWNSDCRKGNLKITIC